MAIQITNKTVVATYHHARQSDLDPTPLELQGWTQILQSNYERILPSEMVAQNLDPANTDLVDLALLLSELTEESGVLARARRGCAVVAGLQRAGTPFSDSAAMAKPLAAARTARARRPGGRRSRKTSRGRTGGGTPS